MSTSMSIFFSTDKYADEVISYIIGAAASTKPLQEVVDAVQRWCDDNQMPKLASAKLCTLSPITKHRYL